MFPEDLQIPADLGALSAEEFAAFFARFEAYARTAAADENTTAGHLIEVANVFSTIRQEGTRRTEEAAAAQAARAELTAAFAVQPDPAPQPEPQPEPAPEPVPAPQAVTAARSTLELPPEVETPRRAVLTASSDVPNAGQEIASFADAAQIIERRLASYGGGTGKAGNKAPIGGKGTRFKMGGRSLTRHGAVNVRREYDSQLRITDANKAMEVLEYARQQSRLPGGSLFNAMENQVNKGVALTAAAGWCAPSETIYDLCTLATREGILDVPEVQASRGGFFIPENGGISFAEVYDEIGDNGDVILTEYDVINGVDKVCVEIPCPDFVEVRMDVAYLCLTGALLQRRGYPEAIDQFTQNALIGLDHKVNASVIQRIRAQSTNGGTIAIPANNSDGASQVLSAVELAAVDLRYRHRMSPTQTLEIVLPIWAMAPIRAAIARRAGVAELAVTDAEILSWFRVRNVVPHFVYDYQDAFSSVGLTGAPGAATPITAFPANVEFIIYPAGTWLKPVRDVVQLDTVYDNAMLTQNQYTALFAEDGFNIMKMCAESRYYTTPIPVAGVTGQPA